MDNSRPQLQPADSELLWRFLVAVGAGAAVGLLVGGIGGRLVMLVLRLASDGVLRGVTTDDGFEIGRISTSTLFLLMVTAGLGAAAGVIYLILRSTLPRRGRAACFGLVAALVTGADIVKPDGIDFALLDPKPFAIASFVLLPGIAAFSIALLVERLLAVEPWSSRALTVTLGAASLSLLAGLLLFAAVAAGALAARRVPRLLAVARSLGRIVVPIGLVVLSIWSAIELWRHAVEII